jgi:long-chain acyl-CoA synthetase
MCAMKQSTESKKTPASPGIVLDGKTLVEVFLKRVALTPDHRAFLTKQSGSYQPIAWKEVHEQSLGCFEALQTHGIKKGDRVAILSNSRPEWFIADMAIQTLGAVTVPVYQSSTQEDIAYILQHSGAKLVFAEDSAQAEKLEKLFQSSLAPLPVIFFSAPKKPFPFASQLFSEVSAARDREASALAQSETVASIVETDTASIVYTSGTTGQPKGARLAHSCLAAEIRSITQEIELTSEDMCLTFLPFAHVLGRVESLVPLMSGISLAFAENVSTVFANMQEVKPTILMSVPRIYEKIYAKILSDVGAGSDYKKKLFDWAVETGRATVRARSVGNSVSLVQQLKHQVADQLIFSKVRSKLGGKLRFTISGGAPLSQELCEFFHACGVKILEGYGLTETTCAIAVNRPNDYRFGTVGRPLAWTDFRIADDGEIQVRGPAIFSGYFENEAATKEAFTEDGWFCTGDIGEFAESGFLKITDRKKELIVTSGGKNIAPQKLENLLKQIPLVSNALVYGDKKKYLVALLTLSEPETKKWAKARGIAFTDFSELVRAPELAAHFDLAVKTLNKSLASYESIKRFHLLANDFTLESGELTPSLKLKRKVITHHYLETLESLY